MKDQESLVSKLNLKDLKGASKVFRAINHPLRLSILQLIEENKSLNVTRIYIKLRIEQSVASQHLAILRDAQILNHSRDGKEIHYSINHERIEEVLNCMEKIK